MIAAVLFRRRLLSQIELEEQCNVSFMRRAMAARFDTGRSTKIKYSNIQAWNYTNSTKLKMDTSWRLRSVSSCFCSKKLFIATSSASTTETTLETPEHDYEFQRFAICQPDARRPKTQGFIRGNQLKKGHMRHL